MQKESKKRWARENVSKHYLKKLKQYKIATLRHLKHIIENAELIADEVENIHEENGYMFAYFVDKIIIDGELVYVKISVKKKVTSNWFWIHNIDEKKF